MSTTTEDLRNALGSWDSARQLLVDLPSEAGHDEQLEVLETVVAAADRFATAVRNHLH